MGFDQARASELFRPILKETLINSEFPQHKAVLPYSMTVKPLNMKRKVKCDFTFFLL